MGAIGSILGGAILGIGMSSRSKTDYAPPALTHAGPAASAPEAPATPVTPGNQDSGAAANALMEAEREKERQKALLRRQQSREVFTSGLGAAGMAETSKKQLLGG